MRRAVVPLLTGLIFQCGPLAAQIPVWTQFPNSPGGTTRNDDIYFAGQSAGWSARGTSGIYRTVNGGQTWTKVVANTNPVAHFRCIGFASTTRGWAGNLGPGSYDGSVNDTNVLYETFDGGEKWSVVPSINESGMKGFCALHVRDSQHIYGAGRVRGPAWFAKTENGGASWFTTNLTAAGVMGGLMDVYFKDAMNGFVVGMDTNAYNSCVTPYYHGGIARTTNGGLSWFVVAKSGVNCSYFWKMSWPSPDTAYATLQQNGAYDTVTYYKTTDGGATWHSNGIPLSAIGASSFFLQGVGFVTENEGWMGGSSTLSPPFSFIHTTNGGLNWTPEGYNNTRSINRIRFVSPTLGYMSGQALHVYHVPLAVTGSPTNQPFVVGTTATFNVVAQGTDPLTYQWRFHGTNITGANSDSYTITNVQLANAGPYDVVISDFSGSLTSSVALLTPPYNDDFDSYNTPGIVTTTGTTNGYKIFFRSDASIMDFKAVFGFDYSTVTYPTNIPSAPHSKGGTTKGLFLTVNKDATAAAAAVNLYPVNQSFAGNFALKFDLWINWADLNTSTEHALFGINHSGNVTNRVGQSPSDGLFFAVEGEHDSSPTSPTLRDFSVFRGGGSSAPTLMTTNNTSFGPTPPLGPQFDNNDPGFLALFPSKTIPGYGTTPAGTAGLGWVEGELRQVNGLITWLLNGIVMAQYTNNFAYTNGNILIGYNDHYSSIGDSNNFAVFDNLRVEPIILSPVTLLSPRFAGNDFAFGFATEPYESYTVQWATNLSAANWTTYTNLVGNGDTNDILVPLSPPGTAQNYFRVNRP